MKTPHFLFFSQLCSHLGLLYLIFYGVWWQWLVCISVYFFTGCLGMSITYHRLLSHRSWRAPLWFKRIGVLLGTLGMTGSALAWVAVHRQHHSSPDASHDPHSPNIFPWWKVQFFSMYYRPNLRYVKDLLKDKFIVFCHRKYFFIHVSYILTLVLISPEALSYCYLAPAAILWHGGSLINTVGHKWGYRNYPLPDESVNNPILGVFMWGEGWHNNHHAKPYKKSFKTKWWEFDVSAHIISLLELKNGSSIK